MLDCKAVGAESGVLETLVRLTTHKLTTPPIPRCMDFFYVSGTAQNSDHALVRSCCPQFCAPECPEVLLESSRLGSDWNLFLSLNGVVQHHLQCFLCPYVFQPCSVFLRQRNWSRCRNLAKDEAGGMWDLECWFWFTCPKCLILDFDRVFQRPSAQEQEIQQASKAQRCLCRLCWYFVAFCIHADNVGQSSSWMHEAE